MEKYFKLRAIVKILLWVGGEIIGVHYISWKLFLGKEKGRHPPSFIGILWILIVLIGVYTAIYSLANSRYSSRVNLIESRTNAILLQLSTRSYLSALSRIPSVQLMTCPHKPELLNPIMIFKLNRIDSTWETFASTFICLWGKDTLYEHTINLLRETIENWKDTLSRVNLNCSILDGADLSAAHLDSADLNMAHLSGSRLSGSHLNVASLGEADLFQAKIEKAHLIGACLVGAKLQGANLRGADLRDADLSGADLRDADLSGADLRNASLRNANLMNASLNKTSFSGGYVCVGLVRKRFSGDVPYGRFNGADFKDADLSEANISGAKICGTNLSEAKSLYMAKMDKNVLDSIRANFPEILARKGDSLVYENEKWVTKFDLDSALLEKIKKPNWPGWPE